MTRKNVAVFILLFLLSLETVVFWPGCESKSFLVWTYFRSLKVSKCTVNVGPGCAPESTEWFIEDQAFRSCDSAPRPPPPYSPVIKLSLFLNRPVCRRSSLLRGEEGWVRSQIIQPRESLLLYYSFNTLWCAPFWNYNAKIIFVNMSEYSSPSTFRRI
jgi:hypothetical protein